ncbi:MAG: redox-regulated ATPase YchF [Patescibacteria group bacterium]|nr:redox-regulated ATPase YchF [Patescibacteria group bacterium]
MNLSVGIVGLPNVGKSTLFNALLKKQVADVANYPFCTIEPNVGIVEVPNERLKTLAKIVETEKIIPAFVKFYDIAGLVKGASTGQGLGNKFLSYIREVAAIVHVVRLFEDKNVVHVSSKIDPADDIKTIDTELILADLQTIEKQKPPMLNSSKEDFLTFMTLKKIKKFLNEGVPVISISLNNQEKEAIKRFNFLTAKPVIFAFNISENQLKNLETTEERIKEIIKTLRLKDLAKVNYIFLCAKLESEIASLPSQEQKNYLKVYSLQESGLDKLIKKSYQNLDLISFFTCGRKEVRAWTIRKGTFAPQAAGLIHGDFEKYFVKAEVIAFEKFVEAGGWTKAREMGLVQVVGKDYQIREGEVVEFKVNI